MPTTALTQNKELQDIIDQMYLGTVSDINAAVAKLNDAVKKNRLKPEELPPIMLQRLVREPQSGNYMFLGNENGARAVQYELGAAQGKVGFDTSNMTPYRDPDMASQPIVDTPQSAPSGTGQIIPQVATPAPVQAPAVINGLTVLTPNFDAIKAGQTTYDKELARVYQEYRANPDKVTVPLDYLFQYNPAILELDPNTGKRKYLAEGTLTPPTLTELQSKPAVPSAPPAPVSTPAAPPTVPVDTKPTVPGTGGAANADPNDEVVSMPQGQLIAMISMAMHQATTGAQQQQAPTPQPPQQGGVGLMQLRNLQGGRG